MKEGKKHIILKAGEWFKCSSEVDTDLIAQITKERIQKTILNNLKKGIKTKLDWIKPDFMHDDFVRNLFTIVIRYNIRHIPRFANPLYIAEN